MRMEYGASARIPDGLIKPTLKNSKTYTFTYNALGQRVKSSYSHFFGANPIIPVTQGEVTDYTREYSYDNLGRLISESIIETLYGEGTESSEIVFLYDESSVIGMVYTSGGMSNTYYYLKNLQGDVVGIYNTTGTMVVRYNYDAWGNCTVASGTTDYTLARINPIRYRGYYFDADTGLYYLNSRYYNPQWRRFISPDDTSYLNPETPNGLNLYVYCNNDPVNYADPSGHFVITVSAVLWAIAIGFTIGATSGAVFGGLTAFANGQDVWAGIGIGALTGGFMGAGAGVASLFIAPVLIGEGVMIATATGAGFVVGNAVGSGASLAIGTSIAFGTGAIGGAVSDILTQISNTGKISDWGSVGISALQWGAINTAGAFIGSLGGPLSNFETAVVTIIFNNVTGVAGLATDVIRDRSNKRQTVKPLSYIYGYGY